MLSTGAFAQTYTGKVVGQKAVIGDGVSKSTITGSGFEVKNATVATQVVVGTGLNVSTITGAGFAGDGSALLNLGADKLTTGTVNDGRLSGNVTLQGNTFNVAGKLVQLDSSGNLPAGVGAIHRSVEGSNGTLGVGTKFLNLVPTGAIQLTKISVTILTAGEGTGNTVWKCGTSDGNALSVTTDDTTAVGAVVSDATGAPLAVAAGTTVSGWMVSSAQTITPTASVVCEYN